MATSAASAPLRRRAAMHLSEIRAPAILCAAMLAVGLATCALARVAMGGLLVPYFLTTFGGTGLALLVSMFVWIAGMARAGEEAPLRRVAERIRSRGPLLLLPTVVLALFLIGFTAAKTAIAFLVGFSWDQFWTDADRLIFRDDVWHIAQGLLGVKLMPAYAWFYTVGWGAAFMGTAGLIAINAEPRKVGVFYTAMFLTWLIGGWAMAMTVSAAGPAFAALFSPALGASFAPLHQAIGAHLPPHNSLRLTQAYLASSIGAHVALKGGGISAMPSMHLGAASIYVLAARGTKWLAPALLFWAAIFLLSGYFGYHYWVDGLVAAAVAWACWRAAQRWIGARPEAPDGA